MQTLTIDCEIDGNRELVVKLPAGIAPGRHRIEIVIDPPTSDETTVASGGAETSARAERWSRLLALREEAIARGMPLLEWRGIDAEQRERRGGVEDD
jgi:hypothetical protein